MLDVNNVGENEGSSEDTVFIFVDSVSEKKRKKLGLENYIKRGWKELC